ncbi:MAG: hypothetical protein FJW77_04210 [Actinobacteria bacterium]|nr:hypothetical protein [Actinomycetota bacterium]
MAPVTDADDLAPRDWDCLRCGRIEPMVFRGLCGGCRDAVRTGARRERRDVAVADYEPKMNVTPNAVALKDD